MTEQSGGLTEAIIRQHCKTLHLPTIGSQFARRAAEAVKGKQSHMEYLEALLAAELEDRERRTVERRIREAHLPKVKTLEEFEFSKAPTISPAQIRELDNFGYRLGLSWDPSGEGRMALRFGSSTFYDEFDSRNLLYGVANNPPTYFPFATGTQLQTPIVYGLAPEGTSNFAPNPAIRVPQLTPQGGVEGVRTSIAGYVTDLQNPRIWETQGGIQYELLNNLMVQADYRYLRGTSEFHYVDYNRFGGDLLDGRLDRLNPNFGSISLLANAGRRVSHNMVLNVTKRFNHGWSLSSSYTYTHAKDNLEIANLQKAASPTDPFAPSGEYARIDIPHTFVTHAVWELPFWRTRADWLGRIVGGWQLNTVWNFQSGAPFLPVSLAAFGSGGDFNADGLNRDRPDEPAQGIARSYDQHDWVAGAFPASVFPLPSSTAPRAGTLPRDYFRGPGYTNVDLAFVKEFRLPVWSHDEGRLQLRGEFFNLANRLNISSVQTAINTANFARATAANPNRIVQLSVKFLF